MGKVHTINDPGASSIGVTVLLSWDFHDGGVKILANILKTRNKFEANPAQAGQL